MNVLMNSCCFLFQGDHGLPGETGATGERGAGDPGPKVSHISNKSVQILQMSQSHGSVLRVILEQRECPVCRACLVRTELLGKRCVQDHSLQYAAAKCNNVDVDVL